MEPNQLVNTTMKHETTQHKTNPDEEMSQRRIDRLANDEFEYKKQAQWLRTMILETIDGLFTTTSLMMGVGVITKHYHVKSIIVLCGLAGILVGAIITAVGEFRSISSRRREAEKGLVHPLQGAVSSALVFSTGGMIPLMARLFVKGYVIRFGAVAGVMSMCFAVFGWLGAFLGGASWFRAGLRVLLFCWVAMAFTLDLVVPQW
ncbi:vacuolar iron transporter homolog 1-like [Chenopodium quinoa]|uniref:vacuolar iron transporter homolog 1-like n=1 Tax=Chenopodium quinoa TaxID=63459 RepID=UPI000B790526|nr:vacuolar iron transporter homolog 1-like [Chenopodium quinoa]